MGSSRQITHTGSSGGFTLGGQRSIRRYLGDMRRAEGMRLHLTCFRPRGREGSTSNGVRGTFLCSRSACA